MEIPEWTKKIEYGLTNESYLLKTDEVLRVGKQKINQLIDRENEIKILKLLETSSNNITVKILNYGFDENKNFLLRTKYLPFTYNLVQQKIDKKRVDEVYNCIKKFRNINTAKSEIKVFDWKEQINIFKNNIKNPQINLTEYEIEVSKIFSNYKPKKLVLSHNSLVRNNFLFNDDVNDKKMYLIDFEYSSLNDELYDVASFISESLIYEEKEEVKEELIKYWISLFKLSKDKIDIVKKWIFYQNIISVFWANAMYDITKEKTFLKIIELKYHEIKKMY